MKKNEKNASDNRSQQKTCFSGDSLMTVNCVSCLDIPWFLMCFLTHFLFFSSFHKTFLLPGLLLIRASSVPWCIRLDVQEREEGSAKQLFPSGGRQTCRVRFMMLLLCKYRLQKIIPYILQNTCRLGLGRVKCEFSWAQLGSAGTYPCCSGGCGRGRE